MATTTKKPVKKAVVKKQAAKKSPAKKVAAKKQSPKKDDIGKLLNTLSFKFHEDGIMVEGDANSPQLINVAKIAAKMANERIIHSMMIRLARNKKEAVKKAPVKKSK